MMDILIFNDASLPFSCPEDCLKNIESFFEIMFYFNEKKIKLNRADGKEGDWNSYIYADGFEFGHWLNNINDIEVQRLVKAVVANVKSPLISMDLVSEQEPVIDTLFSLAADRDIEVNTLGIASAISAHSLSFASHINWKKQIISIIKTKDILGEMQDSYADVPNIFSVEQISNYLNDLDIAKKSQKGYLQSIEVTSNDDYPNLIFCSSALKNITSSAVTMDDIHNILYVLNQLNESIVASTSLTDLITNSKLNISLESRETMNCSKHARKRMFKHPDLGILSFEAHIKNFQNGKRMHILADYENNTVTVGYFGLHLSTIKYP